MEISVLGPGAVGTLLGGLLSSRGHRVSLVGKSPPPRPEMTVRMILPSGWREVSGVRCVGPAEAPANAEVALVAMGRHHVHLMKRPDFSRLTGSEETTVAMLNADPLDAERLCVEPQRRHRCLTLLNAVKLQEGDVELTSSQPALVVERSPALLEAVQALESFGIRVIPVDDARPYANALFLYQLLFLPVAMCDTTLEAFLAVPQGRELALRVLQEGFAAADRAALPVARLPVLDPWELAARLEKKPTAFEAERHLPGRAYNSVLQAFLQGRPTEAAHLNRRIVEIASEAGLHLTWNWRLFQKASRIASVGFFRDPAELLRSLA